jgi:pre-peptidase
MLALLSGCSFLLDFSNSAIPKDAPFDSAFTPDECAFGEPNDTPDTAFMLQSTDVGPGATCSMPGSDDHDFYRFTVPANTASVTVMISFPPVPNGDLDLRLYDKTGATVLARSSGFGQTEAITCPGPSPACAALAPDDYIFEVFPGAAGAVNRYDIAITLTPM